MQTLHGKSENQENNFRMVKLFVAKPTHKVYDDNTLLGWSTMVAPTSKIAVPPHTSIFNSPLLGNVQKLPGGINATAKVAPSLCSVIRKTLEGKQIKTEDIDTYLKQNKSLGRYDSAFRTLWAICVERNITLDNVSIYHLASQILFLNKYSPSQARNAYNAMLLIPGWDQLRFCP